MLHVYDGGVHSSCVEGDGLDVRVCGLLERDLRVCNRVRFGLGLSGVWEWVF